MLVLTFQVGHERWALDIRRVTEVVPRVHLEPLAGSPAWMAGVFVYRGQVIPVIDLHRLIGAGECPPHLSSRIILVPHGGAGDERLLGLLAAHVADLRELQPPVRPLASFGGAGLANLGPVMADELGIVHLLELERLLPETLQLQLAAVPRGLPA